MFRLVAVGSISPRQAEGLEEKASFLSKSLVVTVKVFIFAPVLQKRPAEIAQLVEHNLAKVGVASSSLVFRSENGRLNPYSKLISEL